MADPNEKLYWQKRFGEEEEDNDEEIDEEVLPELYLYSLVY